MTLALLTDGFEYYLVSKQRGLVPIGGVDVHNHYEAMVLRCAKKILGKDEVEATIRLIGEDTQFFPNLHIWAYEIRVSSRDLIKPLREGKIIAAMSGAVLSPIAERLLRMVAAKS
jgi:hypothetical protein